MSQKGTLLRGADGKLFFLRDEVLAACEVTEPEMKSFCEGLIEESGAKIEGAAIDRVAQASVPTKSIKDALGSRAMSTVMCPGVMHDGSIHILESKAIMIESSIRNTIGRGITLKKPRG